MKKQVVIGVTALLTLLSVPLAQAAGWGLGGFVGSSIPIEQEDAERGIVFGAQLRMGLGGVLGVEPNVTFFRNGDWTLGDDGIGELFEGSRIFAVGVNAVLGGSGGPAPGLRPFLFGGVKYYNEKNDFRDFSEGSIGWNAGIGFEIGAGPLGIEGRASGELLPLDGGGSRKWVHLRGGVNYYFGIL